MRTITIGRRTYTILFPELLRPLTPEERTDLRESVRARGRVVQAVVTDEDRGVIDGGNRLEIAAELGLSDVPVWIEEGLTLEQKRELAQELNERRRHLTPEELRQARVCRVAQAHQAGKSTRAIAEDEGVSQAQVLRDLKVEVKPPVSPEILPDRQPGDDTETEAAQAQVTPPGSPEPEQPAAGRQAKPPVSPPPKTVTGKDGKRYKATKAKPVANGQVGGQESHATDSIGVPITDPVKLAAFRARQAFAEAISLGRKLADLLNEIAQAPGGEHLRHDLVCTVKTVDDKPVTRYRLAQLDALIHALKVQQPHASLCAYCYHVFGDTRTSTDCRACHGRGWLPESLYKHAPEDHRAKVEALKAKEGGKA